MYEPNGLYYMRARYYDPSVGRFISEDPLGLDGGVNLYAYSTDNPINYIDPLGLESAFWGYWDLTSAIMGVFGGAETAIQGGLLTPTPLSPAGLALIGKGALDLDLNLVNIHLVMRGRRRVPGSTGALVGRLGGEGVEAAVSPGSEWIGNTGQLAGELGELSFGLATFNPGSAAHNFMEAAKTGMTLVDMGRSARDIQRKSSIVYDW